MERRNVFWTSVLVFIFGSVWWYAMLYMSGTYLEYYTPLLCGSTVAILWLLIYATARREDVYRLRRNDYMRMEDFRNQSGEVAVNQKKVLEVRVTMSKNNSRTTIYNRCNNPMAVAQAYENLFIYPPVGGIDRHKIARHQTGLGKSHYHIFVSWLQSFGGGGWVDEKNHQQGVWISERGETFMAAVHASVMQSEADNALEADALDYAAEYSEADLFPEEHGDLDLP